MPDSAVLGDRPIFFTEPILDANPAAALAIPNVHKLCLVKFIGGQPEGQRKTVCAFHIALRFRVISD
jgi:hypothetical protein